MEILYFIAFVGGMIYLFSKSSKSDRLQDEMYSYTRKLDKILNEVAELNRKLDAINHREQVMDMEKPSSKTEEAPISLVSLPNVIPVHPIVAEAEPVVPVDEPTPSPEPTPEVMNEQESHPIEEKTVEYIKREAHAVSKPSYHASIQMGTDKGYWEEFKENNPDLEKFVGENLISKIGISILVLGISFFVKYAIDQDWINESGRVGIGILAGVIILGFAQYLHQTYKAFSSILVAGAVTVFYFTIAYGFHQYHLFSQTVAFAIMVVITAFSTLISIYYDRQELAVLSVIGGFAVPFMVSTGDGNYIILFSYLMILNIGMMLLSYFKSWEIVKMLSFVLTYAIYLGWFQTKYPDIHAVAHDPAFLIINAFYVIFLVVNVVDILKQRAIRFAIKVGFMLLNTSITYFISMSILSAYHPEWKGAYTLSFSIVNLAVTYLVYRKNAQNKTMIYLLLGLTLTFATLAVPVQFDGYYITLFWAGEALLLMWLSYKSKQDSFFTASIIVYLLTLISLAMDWGRYHSGATYPIVFNTIFMTGVVVNISIYAASFMLRRYTMKLAFTDYDKFDSNIFLVVGVFLSYLIGFFEVQYQSSAMTACHLPGSYLMSYHYIFTTVAVLFFARYQDNKVLISILLSFINLLLFIVFNAYQPFREMSMSMSQSRLDSTAFYANFVYLICMLISIGVLMKIYMHHAHLFLISKKYLISCLLLWIVFLFSNQLLIYILEYHVRPEPTFLASYIALKTQMYKVLYPIIWGSLCLIYLAYGIRNKNRPVRIVSLVLLLITVIKLFSYDISTVSKGGKIIAFILLGVLILIMSFMYQKIKFIIKEESNSDDGHLKD